MIRRLLFSLFLLLICSMSLLAESITYTFANGRISNDGNYKYYEFDIEARGAVGDTRIGSTQVYLNYNSNAFGQNVYNNSNPSIGVVVTKGALTQGSIGGNPSLSYYGNNSNQGAPILNNNTSSRLAITIELNFANSTDWSNPLPAAPSGWAHVKMKILNDAFNAGLSFQQALMGGQQYLFNNSTKYNPVIAEATDDADLNPIVAELSSFTATAHNEQVHLQWQTLAEVDQAGFNVYRSVAPDSGFIKLNAKIIPAEGNATSGAYYSYIDSPGTSGLYYYKLQDVSLSGALSYSSTISVNLKTMIAQSTLPPETFELRQNYPNPFNPETRIEYQLAQQEFIELSIYNLSG
ncbi:MAG: hypothetical protein EHM72_02185, partial [Calditrichaeota bacterium]